MAYKVIGGKLVKVQKKGKRQDRFTVTGRVPSQPEYQNFPPPEPPPPANPKPDPALKGVKNGNCNMTRCQRPGATWYNHGSHAYYCEDCAWELNHDGFNKRHAMEMFGHPLCTPSP